MTDQEIICFAEEAASAAFDAHGHDQCSPRIAAEFMATTRFEEFEGSDQDAEELYRVLKSLGTTRLFQTAYWAKYAGLCQENRGA
jgi:hypothetical protein